MIYGQAINTEGETSYQSMARLSSTRERILDFGCGDGMLLESLLDSGHPAEALVGVDFAQARMYAIA